MINWTASSEERKPRTELQKKAYARNRNLLNNIIPAQKFLGNCNPEFLTKDEEEAIRRVYNILEAIKEKYKENNFEFGLKTSVTFYTKEQYKNYIKNL